MRNYSLKYLSKLILQKNIIKYGNPNYVATFQHKIRIALITTDFHNWNYIIAHNHLIFFAYFGNLMDVSVVSCVLSMDNPSSIFINSGPTMHRMFSAQLACFKYLSPVLMSCWEQERIALSPVGLRVTICCGAVICWLSLNLYKNRFPPKAGQPE